MSSEYIMRPSRLKPDVAQGDAQQNCGKWNHSLLFCLFHQLVSSPLPLWNPLKRVFSKITSSSNKHFTFNHCIFLYLLYALSHCAPLLKLFSFLFFHRVSVGNCSPVAWAYTKAALPNPALSLREKNPLKGERVERGLWNGSHLTSMWM